MDHTVRCPVGVRVFAGKFGCKTDMEVLLQLLDELDDTLGALAHGALAIETRLAAVAGWAAGIAIFVFAVVGLGLGLGG
jgi:hypothetical protein